MVTMWFWKRTNHNRRGWTLVIVLVFLFVAAMMGFGLNWLTRSHKAMSYHSYYNEICYQLGHSALRAAAREYFEKLNDPTSDLYLSLARGEAYDLDLPRFQGHKHEGLRIILKDFKGADVYVDGRLVNMSPITGMAVDPAEKRGFVELVAHASYREVNKTLFAGRRFKFVSAVPPVTSRFNFFVREVKGEEWNVLESKADGSPNNAGRAPLALVNGDSIDVRENGWIYLGEDKLYLNLGRGVKSVGEDFHLPATLTRSVFFPSQKYVLLHLNVGFWSDAAKEPAFEQVPDKSAFKSSSIRLFGADGVGEGKATPTLVIGDVWRRYLQAAAVGPLNGDSIEKVIQMPWLRPSTPHLVPTETGFPPCLFLSFPLYQVYMSQIREEPFNRSYDYIVTHALGEEDNPPPLYLKTHYKAELGDVYPLRNPELKLKNYRDEEYYTGHAKDFRSEPAMMDKRTIEADSIDDLFNVYMVDGPDGKVLELNGIYHIRGEEPVNLRKAGSYSIGGRGILIFDKHAGAGNLELVDPEKDMLSLISLKGKLHIAGPRCQASLVALENEIGFGSRTSFVGNMACKKLDGQEMLRGAVLRYDNRMNAEKDVYGEYYVLDWAPTFHAFREVNE